MKHSFIKSIIGILLILSICSCGGPEINKYDTSTVPHTEKSRFFVLPLPYDKETSDFQILVDKETRVEYLFFQSGYQGALTPLLDKDGNITFYKGEIK